MKLQRLKIFECISRHKNVTAAAAELQISQPVASMHLKILEQEYGLTLFKRTSVGMELTEQGRALLEATRPILQRIEELETRFKQRKVSKATPPQSTTKPEMITVGSNYALLQQVFSNVLTRFRERWDPAAPLVLEVGSSDCIENLTEESRLDVALISNPRYLVNCEYENFLEMRYDVVVATTAHSPLAKRGAIGLEELLQQPLVVRAASAVVEELRQRGHRLQCAFQFHAPESAKLAITQGLGVGLVLRSWVQAEIDSGELVAVPCPDIDALTYQSFIVWNRRRPLGKAAQQLIQTMRQMKTERRPA